MNKKLLLVALFCLLAISFAADNTSNNTDGEVGVVREPVGDEDFAGKQTACHYGCNCEQTKKDCAECNICTSCKQTEGTQVVRGDFCQCLTPEWIQKDGEDGSFRCVEVSVPEEFPNCEWELFNQIYQLVVNSKCSIEQVGGQNVVFDDLTYDFRRLTNISTECENQLKTKLLISRGCNESYLDFNTDYILEQPNNQLTQIRIPLINVFEITDVITTDQRTIFQTICLAIQLGSQSRVLREHRFQIRVYTNRDQVEVFHLTITKQITEGCDRGQECIVVADLDVQGHICLDYSCAAYYNGDGYPTYTVGDYLYVRIEFIDNSYTKYLQVQSVKFSDDLGVYRYNQNQQWWQLRQNVGSTDVKILLFQPSALATFEVALKIALTPDNRVRALASTEGEITKFTSQVIVGQKAQASASDSKSNFSGKLFCGFVLAALALLF